MIPDTLVKTLEQAQEKLQQAISLSACDEADYRRDWIKGYEEGELKKAREAALNAVAMGLSVKQTTQLTGLSENEIRELGH